jgi:hypothetical protein
VPSYAMVGYPILGTLSEHAAVTRGICELDAAGNLQAIVERMKVERTGTGARYLDESGTAHPLTGREVVSMNFWGFTPAVFDQLEDELISFLEAQLGAPQNSECLIPVVVGQLLREEEARVRVLSTSDAWFGVTHPEDKPIVMKTLREMVARGDYPSPIWTVAG